MIKATQRTLYFADIQLHQALGETYKPVENTTLNEKFNVLVNESIPDGKYPTINYFAIGTGGSTIVSDAENYQYSEHGPMDGALFNHIPWVMRDSTSNDLDNTEKLKYRLRTIETVNGVRYACYYLKVITQIELKKVFYSIRTILNQLSVSSPTLHIYNTNIAEILSPTPRTRKLDYDTIDESEYCTKSAKLYFELTENDITELNNVMTIRGLEGRNITELAACTGVDIDYNNYKESIASQIAIHIAVNLDLVTLLRGKTSFTKSIDIGGNEPLIK